MRVNSWRGAVGVWLIGAIFFSCTNPSQGQSLVIVSGSVIVAMTIYVWSALAMRGLVLCLPLSIRARRLGVAIITSVSMLLLLMQSIGQLDWRDTLAVLPVAAVIYMYVTYVHSPERRH